MTRRVLCLGLVALILAGCPATGRIIIVNESVGVITEVNVVPEGSEWGESVLDGVIRHGEHFPVSVSAGVYDVRVIGVAPGLPEGTAFFFGVRVVGGGTHTLTLE